MKTNVHPKYFTTATVTCICGNVLTTGSTVEKINVDICSKCHPFFTGEMKFIDTLGKVDKFLKKQAASAGYVPKSKKQKVVVKEFKTLKDMLTTGKSAK